MKLLDEGVSSEDDASNKSSKEPSNKSRKEPSNDSKEIGDFDEEQQLKANKNEINQRHCH